MVEHRGGRIRKARELGAFGYAHFWCAYHQNGMAPTLISPDEGRVGNPPSTNGAGIIHDWEFSFQGKSSEDVRENVKLGQFGIWDDTGSFINLALIVGAFEGLGYGESVGKMIVRED